MSGLGGSNRRRHGFRSAHFTDEKDVDVLAKRGLQRALKIFCIDTDFALVDERLFWLKNILDRIFNGDNVFHALLINEFEQGGQSRCLALSYGTHDKKKSLRFTCKTLQNIGQIQLGD